MDLTSLGIPIPNADPVAGGGLIPQLRAEALAIDALLIGMTGSPALDSAYASLSAAVTAIGATVKTLVISTANFAGGSSCTVPSTLTLAFLGVGSINNTNPIIILSGGFFWPKDRQVFMGTGTVSFANNVLMGALQAAWFGVQAGTGTDQTAAERRAVAAALTRDVAIIEHPPGVILIDGALQGPTGHQSRIHIINTQGDSVYQRIMFKGASTGPWVSQTLAFSVVPPTQGVTIFKSTQDGGAIFGGSANLTTNNFTGVEVAFKDLIVRNKDNPNQSGIDGSWYGMMVCENVIADTGLNTFQLTEPSHANASGIVTPAGNNGAHTILYNCMAQGYYNGFIISEHTEGDHLYAVGCKIGGLLGSAGHGVYINRMLMQNCPRGIQTTGACYIQIGQLNFEHPNQSGLNGNPAWQNIIYDIDDSNGYAKGHVTWHVGEGFVGIVDDLKLNGAVNLVLTWMDQWSSSALRMRTSQAAIAGTISEWDAKRYAQLENLDKTDGNFIGVITWTHDSADAEVGMGGWAVRNVSHAAASRKSDFEIYTLNSGVLRYFSLKGTGELSVQTAPAPATPLAGRAAIYVDSTSKKLSLKDDTGAISSVGTQPPFDDGTAIVKGSIDSTKLLRFEVDGFTAATTRVITPPNADTKLPISTQFLTFSGPTADRTFLLPDVDATLLSEGSSTSAIPRFTRLGLGKAAGAGWLVDGEGTVDGNLGIALKNTSTGTFANTQFRLFNDLGDLWEFGIYGSGNAGYGSLAARESFMYSSRSMIFMADNASGAIKFAAGGNTLNMQLTPAASLVLGTAALATNATDGFLYIPSCAGAPTGTPTAFTGRVPMVFDSTNNHFYIYTGGAWKKTTVFA